MRHLRCRRRLLIYFNDNEEDNNDKRDMKNSISLVNFILMLCERRTIVVHIYGFGYENTDRRIQKRGRNMSITIHDCWAVIAVTTIK